MLSGPKGPSSRAAGGAGHGLCWSGILSMNRCVERSRQLFPRELHAYTFTADASTPNATARDRVASGTYPRHSPCVYPFVRIPVKVPSSQPRSGPAHACSDERCGFACRSCSRCHSTHWPGVTTSAGLQQGQHRQQLQKLTPSVCRVRDYAMEIKSSAHSFRHSVQLCGGQGM